MRILCFLLAIIPSTLLAQTLVWSVKGQFDGISVDRVGNCYAWEDEELSQFNAKGEAKYTFSDLAFGSIDRVDATNNFKIMVFYREHGLIRFLDNYLGSRFPQPFNLSEEGFSLPTLVCSSFDNGFWIWDQGLMALTRFDQQRTRTVELNYVNQIIGMDLQPLRMLESNDQLVLVTSEHILLFDVFGTFIKKLPIANAQDVQLIEGQLYYRSEDNLLSYDLATLEQQRIVLPEKEIHMMRISSDRVFLLTEEGISAYNIK